MKKNSKTIKIVAAIVLLGILVLFTWLFLKPKKNKVEVLERIPVVQKPTYLNPISETNFVITFSKDLSVENLPASLPIYKIEKTEMTKGEADTLAQKLGIYNDAIVSDSFVGGLTYIYSGVGPYLRVLPNQRIIDYKTGNLPGVVFSNNPDAAEFTELAIEFLENNKLISDRDELVFNKFRPLYIEPEGHGYITNENHNLVSVNFVKKLGGIPLLGSTHETGVINVIFNNRKQVVSVYIDDISKVTESEKYNIKDIDEIKKSISEMSLQSLNEGIETEDEFDQVRSVRVEKISLAYVQEYEDSQEILQPSFIIEGTATLLKSGKKVTATLYLPAFK